MRHNRPNIIIDKIDKPDLDIARPQPWYERLMGNILLRKFLVVLLVCATWEIGARYAENPLMLPTFLDTCVALKDALFNGGPLMSHLSETMTTLGAGFLIGTLVAGVLTIMAVSSRLGTDLLETVTGAFAPLPAVSVMPLALMWFGISMKAVIFVAGFAVVFPVAVNAFQGFRSVDETIRYVGMNMGLRGMRFTWKVLIPSALPAITAGLRGAASNGLRALVAAELVIGAASGGSGGLGYWLMKNKSELEMGNVFAGLILIMVVGLAFEALFALVERYTVRKWGMLH